MAFTDCTDQQIPRPVDKRRKKNFYSGIKTQLMVNNQGTIIHKTNYKKGRRHDYDIYKKDHPVTPKEVVNIFDLGYLVEKDSRTTICTAIQKEEKSRFISGRERTQQKSF